MLLHDDALTTVLQGDLQLLLARPHGQALAAMLANKLAKEAQYELKNDDLSRTFYKLKSSLLASALRSRQVTYWAASHAHGDYGQVMIMVEDIPGVGQLAFHVRRDDPDLADLLTVAPEPAGRAWDGVKKQESILAWIRAYAHATDLYSSGTKGVHDDRA